MVKHSEIHDVVGLLRLLARCEPFVRSTSNGFEVTTVEQCWFVSHHVLQKALSDGGAQIVADRLVLTRSGKMAVRRSKLNPEPFQQQHKVRRFGEISDGAGRSSGG